MVPRFQRRTSCESDRSVISTTSQDTFATAIPFASPPLSTPFSPPDIPTTFVQSSFLAPSPLTPTASPLMPFVPALSVSDYFDPQFQSDPKSTQEQEAELEWVDFDPEELDVDEEGFDYEWLLNSETSSAYDPDDSDEVEFRCESSLSIDFVPCQSAGVRCEEPECPSCRSSL